MCVLNKQGGKQLQISPPFFLVRKIMSDIKSSVGSLYLLNEVIVYEGIQICHCFDTK